MKKIRRKINFRAHAATEEKSTLAQRVEPGGEHLADETLDTLFQGRLKILQSRRGYRFSLDAVLLAYFANVRGEKSAIDLGTGNAVLPMILAFLHPGLKITGLELQQEMADRAARAVRLNGFENRIDITRGDVRAIERIFPPASFAVVLCNPPYRGARSGRISPIEEKKIARHEIEGSLADFLRAGAFLLPVKGRMGLIYPAARMADLLGSMRKAELEPKRLRMVHSFRGAEAALVLAEGVKGGKTQLKILPPLLVYERGKEYSAEVAAMLAGRSAGENKAG